MTHDRHRCGYAARMAVRWAGLVLVFGLGRQQLNTFKRDRDVSAYEMSQSASLRPILATVAWQMFLDRPLFGCGFGQYKQHDVDYRRDPHSHLPLETATPYEQHNTLLALLTETGLIGAGLFALLLYGWFRLSSQPAVWYNAVYRWHHLRHSGPNKLPARRPAEELRLSIAWLLRPMFRW